MNNLATDPAKDLAIFINDFDQEFADGLVKLSERLGRPLRGIILLDSEVKEKGLNTPDKAGVFEQVVCNFDDDAALHAALKQFEPNLLLVTCSDDRNQPYLQKVLPHVPYTLSPTEKSLDWATHKALMREMLTSYDDSLVPKVQHVMGASEKEIKLILDNLTFPMIIKPTGLAASILVKKVNDEQELRDVLTKSFKVIKDIYKRDRGRGKPSMIVEEFIVGHMYSLDAYVNETGTIWTLPLLDIKTAYDMGMEGFSSYQIDSHLELTDQEIVAAYAAAEKAIHALGLRSCVAHVEMYHTDNGWKIIELGPRAGGQRQDIYKISYGVDHAYNELLIKVGLPPETSSEHLNYTTAIKFPAEEEGILEAVEGLEEALGMPTVHTMALRVKLGDMVMRNEDGGKIIVRGLLFSPDREQLKKDLDIVRSTIKIITKNS